MARNCAERPGWPMPGSDGVRDVAQDHWRLDRCDALGGDSKPGISWELARQSPFGATTRAPSHCLREEMRNIANCSKALQVLRRRPVCPESGLQISADLLVFMVSRVMLTWWKLLQRRFFTVRRALPGNWANNGGPY